MEIAQLKLEQVIFGSLDNDDWQGPFITDWHAPPRFIGIEIYNQAKDLIITCVGNNIDNKNRVQIYHKEFIELYDNRMYDVAMAKITSMRSDKKRANSNCIAVKKQKMAHSLGHTSYDY